MREVPLRPRCLARAVIVNNVSVIIKKINVEQTCKTKKLKKIKKNIFRIAAKMVI